jgi:hypothetical protein
MILITFSFLFPFYKTVLKIFQTDIILLSAKMYRKKMKIFWKLTESETEIETETKPKKRKKVLEVAEVKT